MVGLIGIMPSGLSSLHESSKIAIQSRIVQELISDAQQSEWINRPNLPGQIPVPKLADLLGEEHSRIYDSQGTLLANRGAAGKTAAYATLMEEETGNPKILTYQKGYTHLKRVHIFVEYTPGGRTPRFKDPTRAAYVTKYTLLLANMGTSEFIP
jgi:uncharacterized protein (TIGR02598 family)